MPPSPHAPKAATEPKKKAKRLKVRATRMGYYDHARRREGDVFIVEEADFSSTWMEKVSANTPEQLTTAQKALDQQHDEILAGKVATNAGANQEVL